MEPRDPAKGDLDFENLDFESDQDTYFFATTPQQNSPAILLPNQSRLDAINEDEEEDKDDDE